MIRKELAAMALALTAMAPAVAQADAAPAADPVVVETQVIALTDTVRGRPVAGPDLPALRRALQAEAHAHCERLRQRVGSCMIRAVDISESRDALNPGTFYVRARVHLVWLRRDPDPSLAL